jgi:4-hydroxy-tetrahydrodipicolinate reductase
MIRLMINGARGRMGQALIRLAGVDPELSVGAAVDLGDAVEPALAQVDAVIDFSHASATAALAGLCAAAGKPLVIGTTGHTGEESAAIRAVAGRIPMVWASNYSTGVNTLFWLTRRAAEILGPGFDIEVIEAHHRHKKDAPSGTAASLVKILAEARSLPPDTARRHGREGMVGARTPGEIGVHAIRGGDIVGDHTVLFAADGERVELTHKASSRDTFAAGALRAAKWVAGRDPGIYDMQDVLGLKTL